MVSNAAIDSLLKKFASERTCVSILFDAKWPDGFCCPTCLNRTYYTIRSRRLPLYQCRRCGRQTSVTVGTIMEGSSTSLSKWMTAIFLVAQPGGISATRLAGIIKVTYKTAWLIAHKIRHAMQKAENSEFLGGVVRINQMSYGRAEFRDARHPLLIGAALSDTPEQLPLRIKIKQPHPNDVHNARRIILNSGVKSFIQNHLHSFAVSDYVLKGPRRPEISKINWNLNRWLNETFSGIGAKHLQSYCDEFCFRLNLTMSQTPIWEQLIRWSACTPVLIYKELVRTRPVLPVPWLIWGGKAKWKGRLLTLWNN